SRLQMREGKDQPRGDRVAELYPQKLSQEWNGDLDFLRHVAQGANCTALGDRPDVADCTGARTAIVIVTNGFGKIDKDESPRTAVLGLSKNRTMPPGDRPIQSFLRRLDSRRQQLLDQSGTIAVEQAHDAVFAAAGDDRAVRAGTDGIQEIVAAV